MSGTTHNALRTFLHDSRCGQRPERHEDRCRSVVVGGQGVAEGPAAGTPSGAGPRRSSSETTRRDTRTEARRR